jgi:hypothetical protein
MIGSSMSRLRYVTALAVVVLSTRTIAADVELAGRTVHLNPIGGLCALSANEDPTDALLFKFASDMQHGVNELAGYWTDCRGLDAIRKGQTDHVSPYVLILAQYTQGGKVVPLDMPRDAYMAAIKAEWERLLGDNVFLDSAHTMLIDRVEETLDGLGINDADFSVGEFQPIGLLSEDILAYGILAPTSVNGRNRVQAVVFAPMELNGIAFTVNAYDEFRGAETFVGLETMVRGIVSDLTAKNPTNLPQ